VYTKSRLSQRNPAHAPFSYFFTNQFHIIIPPSPRFSQSVLSFRFPHQKPACNPHRPYVRPAHLIFLDMIHLIFGEQNRSQKMEKNEMGGACNAYGGEERCIQGFGGETCGKETTWKTQALMGG